MKGVFSTLYAVVTQQGGIIEIAGNLQKISLSNAYFSHFFYRFKIFV